MNISKDDLTHHPGKKENFKEACGLFLTHCLLRLQIDLNSSYANFPNDYNLVWHLRQHQAKILSRVQVGFISAIVYTTVCSHC